MKAILEEIRSQPAHIREVFMWLCVVITFSVVSFFWFQSTAHEFVAMVNPQKAEADRALAAKTSADQQSVLATISQSAGNLRASMAELFGFAKNSSVSEFIGGASSTKDAVPPQLFPTSKNK